MTKLRPQSTFTEGPRVFLQDLMRLRRESGEPAWRTRPAWSGRRGLALAVGGGLVVTGGIALSVFREKLLALPDQIAHRKGVFSMLNWR
jgi:hypothetical protein